MELVDAENARDIDLSRYDLIGFASGIDFSRFYPAVTQIAESLPSGKMVYALFTCAHDNGRLGEEIAKIAQQKDCVFLGKYGCKGYNTYGPWKIIGGMNKKHPTQSELDKAAEFYQRISKTAELKLADEQN